MSLHGQGLYEGRRGLDPGPPTPRAEREPEVQAFLAEQDEVQADLRRRIGGGPDLDEWAWAGYRLLQTWDVMSLFLTWADPLGPGARLTLPQVPRRAGDPGVELTLRAGRDGAVACDPWPFAGRGRRPAGGGADGPRPALRVGRGPRRRAVPLGVDHARVPAAARLRAAAPPPPVSRTRT